MYARILTALVATVLSGVIYTAQAQDFPTKPLKMVIPFPPAGVTDIVARTMAAKLTDELGQTVVAENRAGASGAIGAEAVARSPADGYTWVMGNISTMAINQWTMAKLNYDPLKSFDPVGMVSVQPLLIAVNPTVPAATLAELVAYAKANPGKLDFASSGSGASVHLSAEVFKQMAGLDLVHIPYKGTGSLLPDLLSGTVAMSFPNLPSALPFIQSGKLKALGVTTAKRSAAAPQIPTLAEAGVPGYDMSTWYGLIGPAGMPPAIITQLNHELNAILQDPVIRQKLVAQGVDPVTGSPEEFGQFIRKETRYWAELIKKAKVELN